MAGPASRVKRKLEGRGRGKSRASLLEDALRDWRSGRAYVGGRGLFMLRPFVIVAGVPTLGHGRPTVAPWNKVAKDPSEGLHKAARAKYPEEPQTDFERMHALDRVRSRLIHESAAMEGVH